MKYITEEVLRDAYKKAEFFEYTLEKDKKLTPSAISFLNDRKIKIVEENSLNDLPKNPESKKYVDFITGETIYKKPENMTHVNKNLLVKKNHPRIILRSKIDSFIAFTATFQCYLQEKREYELVEQLEEIINAVRDILICEVKGENPNPIEILGLTDELMREYSHNTQKYFGIDHIKISYKLGEIICKLNEMRTKIREVEIAAITALENHENENILKNLNRLSSLIYIMMLKRASKQVYGGLYERK